MAPPEATSDSSATAQGEPEAAKSKSSNPTASKDGVDKDPQLTAESSSAVRIILTHKRIIGICAAIGIALIVAAVFVSARPHVLDLSKSSVSLGCLEVSAPDNWLEDSDFPSGAVNTKALKTNQGGTLAISSETNLSTVYEDLSSSDQEKTAQDLLKAYAAQIGASSIDNLTESELDGHNVFSMEAKRSVDGREQTGSISVVLVGNTANYYVELTPQPDGSTDSLTMAAMRESLHVKADEVHLTFMDGDNAISSVALWAPSEGAAFSAPVDMKREGYRASDWKVESGSASVEKLADGAVVSGITEDTSLSAVWTKTWNVTFTDGGGNTLATYVTDDGQAAQAPASPSRDKAKFKGWDVDFSKVTQDMTVNAIWTPVWTVTFTDGMGKTLSTQQVDDGNAASAPSNPTSKTEDFTGWDTDFSSVKGDLTVNANWRPKPTISQKNALAKAKSYLSFTAFSYEGLVEQLEFEQYSHEDAIYAADACGADWNEQAALKAKQYLSFTSFSRGGLIDQLEFEGFTHDQAVYGVCAVGL